MFLVTCHLPVYVPILLTIVTASLHICSGQVKTSDACHGIPEFSQTHNLLDCDEGTQIWITEVRYYQWHPSDQVCPRLISRRVDDRCCTGNPERCSWIRNATDHREKLQRNCTGQSQCDLNSSDPEIIAGRCLQFANISRFSSVRSITYTCTSPASALITTRPTSTSNQKNVTSEEISSTSHTSSLVLENTTVDSPHLQENNASGLVTTHPTSTSIQKNVTSEEISATSHTSSLVLENTTVDSPHLQENNATGAVVGGVIGGLVTCALIVTLLVFLWKRRSGEKPQTLSRSDDVTEIQTVSRPRAAYDNINSRYSLYQPERDDSNTPWDSGAATNVSDLYSQANKTRTEVDSSGDTAFSIGTAVIASNHHGNYDRVQGEAAHFTVHGDYDHVIRHSCGETSSDDITADVDMTYNHLHRGRAVPAKAETEADPYDVLNRANTRTT